MKYIALLMSALFFSNLSYAEITATLNATEALVVNIENRTDLSIADITLTPLFSCSTTVSDGGGESTTLVNNAELDFESGENFVKIRSLAKAISPKSNGGRVLDRLCSVSVMVSFNNEDYFIPTLGEVTSKSKKSDLTKRFSKKLPGQYVIDLVYIGTTYDPEQNSQVPTCGLGLFSRTSTGVLKYLGRAMSYEQKNCRGKVTYLTH